MIDISALEIGDIVFLNFDGRIDHMLIEDISITSQGERRFQLCERREHMGLYYSNHILEQMINDKLLYIKKPLLGLELI